MEKSTKYAYELAKALNNKSYESYRTVNINEATNDLNNAANVLPINVSPSQTIAPIQLEPQFNNVPGMLPIGAYTGEIAFRVVRLTSNINSPLPIPFGSAFAFSQNYLQVLESLCPSGVNVDSCLIDVASNNMTITFSQGALTDQVVIFGDTYNFITFNQGLYTRKALTNIIRYTTPDLSLIYNQVSTTPSRPFKSTWLSNSQIDRNTLTLTPMQYNKNVFDILAQVELSEERGFSLYTFPNAAAPLEPLTYGVQMFFSVIGKI